LYLGSIETAANPRILQTLEITHIVNVSGFGAISDFWKGGYPEWSFRTPSSEFDETGSVLVSDEQDDTKITANHIEQSTSTSETLALTPPAPRYLHIDIKDWENVTISLYFQSTSDFIEQAITGGGKVLCHCQAGVSRSTSLVLAYLILKHNMQLDRAWNIVRRRRKGVRPNTGFAAQLIALHLKLVGCDLDGKWEGCTEFVSNYPGKLLLKAVKEKMPAKSVIESVKLNGKFNIPQDLNVD
ncbi:hypothetical protein HK096_009761, partial [Nowakowskiella sp. JEL0078]